MFAHTPGSVSVRNLTTWCLDTQMLKFIVQTDGRSMKQASSMFGGNEVFSFPQFNIENLGIGIRSCDHIFPDTSSRNSTWDVA